MTASANTASLRDVRAAAYENTRPELRRLVPRSAARIVDLGCASGAVGMALGEELGAEVVGIEADSSYVQAARRRLHRVVDADLEALASADDLSADLGTFDCLIAGDVLEHLVDPWTVLARFASLLEAGGTAVLSLPNVRYWETLWQVGVRGTWPRRSAGIFDRDHLRWFTAADGLELVREAGLDPIQIERQYRFAPRGTRFDRHARRFERTPLRPFLTFQLVIVGRRP